MDHHVDRLTPQQHQHWRDQQPKSYALAYPAEQPELFPVEHEQGELFPSEPRAHEHMRDPN